jgi:hypothetical protein
VQATGSALLAEPDKHSRTGYSAKALAHCWQSARDFLSSVRAIFNAIPFELFQGISDRPSQEQ